MTRSTIAAVMFYLLSAVALGAAALDTPQTRTTAAKRYAAVANMQKMLDDTLTAAAQNMPEKDRAQFLALTKRHVRVDAIEKLTIDAMVKHFTTAELEAMARFYGSKEGQSALAKFGPYTADIMPLIQAEILRAVQEMQKEAQEKRNGLPTGT